MQLVEIEDNKNNIVKKHQKLVHNARYRLSELGIKVVAVLISMIKVEDEDFKEYNLRLNDFKELIGSNSKKTYEYIDVMTDELMKKPFKIGDEKFNWVYYARYHKGDNYVTLKIAPELKPYLLELKNNFLTYNIANVLPLKSSYAIRLYELCKDYYAEATRYKTDKKSITFDIKIAKLKELFDMPKSYQYSSHIKSRILNKAVKQFKEKTDIQISYKEVKLGRKVDTLHITVKENNKGSNDYLNSKQSFISYMRKNYVNANIIKAKDSTINKTVTISIAPDGKIYSKSGEEYDAKRSKIMWDTLYQMALENKLPILQTSKAPKEVIQAKSKIPKEKVITETAIEEIIDINKESNQQGSLFD